MHIPGFTADAALRVTDKHYQLVNYNTSQGGTMDRIVPQAYPKLVGTWCHAGTCCSVWVGDFGVPLIGCWTDIHD
jgi:hypothetical protein